LLDCQQSRSENCLANGNGIEGSVADHSTPPADEASLVFQGRGVIVQPVQGHAADRPFAFKPAGVDEITVAARTVEGGWQLPFRPELKALVQRGIVRRPGLSGPAQQKQSDDQWQQSLHLV
jgi:hypothetical protein